MRFEPTSISGVVVVELEPHADERGFFARFFSQSVINRSNRKFWCFSPYRFRPIAGEHHQSNRIRTARNGKQNMGLRVKT